MKIIIDSVVLEEDGFTLQEFSVLLYYIGGGKGILNEELCNALWDKGFLVKDIEGYILDNNKLSQIQDWMSRSNIQGSVGDRLTILADRMRAEYPEGKKPGTIYYWKDSTQVIAKRLSLFMRKFSDKYSDDQIVAATRDYVKSHNGDYTFMQLLKYFIYKKGEDAGEYNSQLMSYLNNAGQDNTNSDWRDSVR